MKAALSLALATILATLSGCSANAVDDEAASTESGMSRADTVSLDKKLAVFAGRWLTVERRSDQVDLVVRDHDDERGGFTTNVRFETTNLALRYVHFDKIDGGEICFRSMTNAAVVNGCEESKLSSDGRTLTNTFTQRTTDRTTKATVETVSVQTLTLEGEKLHFTDTTEGKKVDLFREWDDKQAPRSSSGT